MRDIEVKEANTKILQLATTSGGSTREIVATVQAGMTVQSLAQMGEHETVSRSTRAKTCRAGVQMKVPTDLTSLVITDEMRKTETGELFVMYDSGIYDEDKRLIMFSTQKNLEFLSNCETLQMDGTFDACPQLFSQLFDIHGKYFITSYFNAQYFICSAYHHLKKIIYRYI